MTKKTRIHDASPGTLTTSVQSTDVETIDWNGDSIAYCFTSGKPMTGVRISNL